MSETWIKLYRKSMDSAVFQNAELWKVWTWCLMRANYEKRHVSVRTGRGQTLVQLEPGQFIFGRNESARELGMSPSSVRNRIGKLAKLGNIDISVDNHFSIISIINWNCYQQREMKSGQPKDNQPTVLHKKAQRKQDNQKPEISSENTVCYAEADSESGQPKDNQRTTKLEKVDTDKNTTKKERNYLYTPLYPPWLDMELWKQFKLHRTKLKKPKTEHAEKLNISKLEKLAADGNDPSEVIKQSIEKGWQGFFPLNNHNGKNKAAIRENQNLRNCMEFANER